MDTMSMFRSSRQNRHRRMEEGEYEGGYEGGYEEEAVEGAPAMSGEAAVAPSSATAGSLFRSEEMALCQLFLQSEAAYGCVSELGELGLVQFRDLNPETNAFQRKFVNEVRRCDEMERKLRFLEKEIKKDEIPMLDTGDSPEAPQPREMIDLEATFEKLEHELREVNQNAEALKRNFLELTELKHILRKTQQFFDEQEGLEQSNVGQHQQLIQMIQLDCKVLVVGPKRGGRKSVKLTSAVGNCGGFEEIELGRRGGNDDDHYVDDHYDDDHCVDGSGCLQDEGGAGGGLQLGFVAGVILRERLPAFERMLWRACRGNVFLRVAEIEDPLEDPQAGDEVFKSVFVIFFQGEQLKSRVKKICEGFRATLYPCPDQASDRREMAVGVMQRLEDLNTVLGQTNDHRHRVLVAAAKNIKIWFIKVRKIKAIYHTLNYFNLDTSQKCLIAECWIPSLDIEAIQLALRRGTEKSGSTIAPILNQMQTTEAPPTFFRTNKYTSAFQALINAYGVATYREANPAVYTIITFPFLFAIMYGDAGHGLVTFGFALWCIIKEKQLMSRKSDSEIWNIFFAGRYLIAIMGIFSIYTGLIYNDVFSKSMNIFGSSWQVSMSSDEILRDKVCMIDPAMRGNMTKPGYVGSPYPFGVDPVWQISINKIVFLNAFKMKLSVIIGVIHMMFGILLSLWNNKYFQRSINIYCEFIPQVIFMSCMFGYMSLLMFHKWTSYVAGGFDGDIKTSERCAPSILITFINMVLFKTNEAEPECDAYMFAGQRGIQMILVLCALSCVPWMLFAKPFLKKKAAAASGEQIDFVEVLILQGIHTIEYVLGSVSHTASYLRLWALSLAHAQLSEVLWNMIMRQGLQIEHWSGGLVLWAIFGAWAVLTVGILCLMEGLSAFLHTLRLHWVEFQSKFYEGQGYLFIPFSFETLLKQAEAMDQ